MLKLGRTALSVVAAFAGLGALVYTMPWLAHVQHGLPVPPGTGTGWLACVLLLGASLLARTGLGRLQREREAAELETLRRRRVFEARGGLRWFLLSVPLGALFAWSGCAALQKGHWGVAAVSFALVALFVLLGWQVARQVLRPGPMLRMDAHGIDHALYGPIRWGDVIGLQLQSVQVRHSTQHTLMLGVRDAPRYLRNAPPLMRWLHGRRLRGRQGVAALPIPLNLLDKDAGLIHASALALRRRDPAPFLEYWHHGMDGQEIDALLRMHALIDDSDRIAAELRAMPDDAGPATIATLEARLREHQARQDAVLPELRMAMDTHARRARRHARGAGILLAVTVALLLLSIALRLLH